MLGAIGKDGAVTATKGGRAEVSAEGRRVALNGRFSGTLQPTGTQTAAFHLFDAIVRAENRTIALTIFADPAFPGIADWENQPRVKLVEIPFSRWSRGRAQYWEQLVLPGLCRRHGCALAHHPIATSPTIKRGVQSIVTLHDLNFLLHPEWYARSFRAVYRLTALPGLRRAERVVAISKYVRDQAARSLGLPPSRLDWIHNGIKPPGGSATSATRPDSPYLLAVGSLQPHKNLARLIDAFVSLAGDFPDLELWVAGRPQPRFRHDEVTSPKLGAPRVKVLGYLSEEALSAAYQNAAIFCYPSLEEGFGLPVLEAMQAGTPVVTSDCSGLREVAGNAAALVDPSSTASIAGAIRKILQLSPEQRAMLVANGREWATRFSWAKAAGAYLQQYAELLGASSQSFAER